MVIGIFIRFFGIFVIMVGAYTCHCRQLHNTVDEFI